jgi:Deoxyinosine 3''endonuclease (endonuclease V)
VVGAAGRSEMTVTRPEFVPDPSLSRDEMEALQRDIAAAAVFSDDFGFGLSRVGAGAGTDRGDNARGETGAAQPTPGNGDERPLVVGVDQAFRNGEAVSAAVAVRGDTVVERAGAVEPAEIPYIPGLLSFREGRAVLSALAALDREPDLLLVDGSGRIHFREAGLATHVGVTADVPAVGVAKNLLCGRPRDPLSDPLPTGVRVAIEADEGVTASDGTVIGHAVQTRQYDSDSRYINPVYTSPGHRVSAKSAAEIVERCTAGYKLPEPTRLADSHADDLKRGTSQ